MATLDPSQNVQFKNDFVNIQALQERGKEGGRAVFKALLLSCQRLALQTPDSAEHSPLFQRQRKRNIWDLFLDQSKGNVNVMNRVVMGEKYNTTD